VSVLLCAELENITHFIFMCCSHMINIFCLKFYICYKRNTHLLTAFVFYKVSRKQAEFHVAFSLFSVSVA
jgi:hypothetical protein